MDTRFPSFETLGFTDGVLPSECPSRIVLNHVTSTWGVLVLVALARSDLRWGELRRTVQGISEKMLAQSLRTLEKDGFVLRTAQPTVPPRVDYSLTGRGREVTAHLLPLMQWIAGNADDIVSGASPAPPAPLGFETGQASISGDYREDNEDSLYASSGRRSSPTASADMRRAKWRRPPWPFGWRRCWTRPRAASPTRGGCVSW